MDFSPSASGAEDMKIILGTGFGEQIRFGMSPSQVQALLGNPDKIIPLDDDEKRVEHQYNQLKMTFRYYDVNDEKLGWIETENPHVELFGVKAIGLNKAEAVKLLSENSPELDDYGSFETIFFEDVWLELQITYDEVSRVKFGVFIDENDEYIWKV